jgi:hypothetical protein
MFDGFWSGIVGELLGPAVGKWLNRFKYRYLFLAVAAIVWLVFFAIAVVGRGWQGAIKAVFSRSFDSVASFVIVPVGIASAAVVLAFLSSVDDKEVNEDGNRREEIKK